MANCLDCHELNYNLCCLSVSQDSSEASDFGQPDCDPGGFPVDSCARQGGRVPPAFLLSHYDQNHLHQL